MSVSIASSKEALLYLEQYSYKRQNFIIHTKSLVISKMSSSFHLLPYSLKFLRTEIFVDFVVLGAPTKFLSMKISHLAVVVA